MTKRLTVHETVAFVVAEVEEVEVGGSKEISDRDIVAYEVDTEGTTVADNVDTEASLAPWAAHSNADTHAVASSSEVAVHKVYHAVSGEAAWAFAAHRASWDSYRIFGRGLPILHSPTSISGSLGLP